MKKIFIKLASLFLILFFVTSCNNGLQNKNTNKKNLVKFSLSVNYDKSETEADNQEKDIFTKALVSRLATPDEEQIKEARNSLLYDLRGYNNKLYSEDSLCDFVMDCPIDELQSHSFEAEAGQWTLILIAHNELNEELYRGEVSVLLKTTNDPIVFYMQPVTEDANSELNLTFKFDYDECISHIEATIQDTGLAVPTDVAEISIDFVNDEATIFDYCNEIKDYFYDNTGFFRPGNNSLEFYTVTYKKFNPESGELETIDDEEIAQAISVIFLFNVLAALIFPTLGHAIGMGSEGFAVFAGTAVNDTSSVTAAASTAEEIYGCNQILSTAVTVKLTRTLAIIPITMILALYRMKKSKDESIGNSFSFKKVFPWFILFFVGASLITTVVAILPESRLSIFYMGKYVTWMKWLAKFFIAMAMSAIGLNTNIISLVKKGGKPIVLGFCCWTMISVVSILIQLLTGIYATNL